MSSMEDVNGVLKAYSMIVITGDTLTLSALGIFRVWRALCREYA